MNRNTVERALKEHRGLALARAFQICRNFFDAEDAVQEASLKAWRKHQDLKEQKKFRPWFATIARNEALRVVRRRSSAIESHLTEQTDASSGDREFLDGAPAWGALWKELKKELTRRQRRMLEDRFVHDLRIKEIAQEHSVSESTVKREIKTAITMLNGLLST